MGALTRSARWRSLLSGAEHGHTDQAPRIRPGRVWYLVGVVLLVGGIGGGVWSGLVGAPALVDSMDRFDAPGSVIVEFAATGDHTMFHEYPTGTSPTLPTLPAFGPSTDVLDIEARPLDGGGPAAQVRPMRGSVTYSLGDTSGVGIARLVVPRPGTYEVTVRLPDDAVGGVVALDSQGAMGTRFFGAIAGGVLLGLAGGTLGSLALLLVLMLRIVAKRRSTAAAGSPPPSSPPGPIPPAPGGPPGTVPPPPAPPYPPPAPPPGRPVDGR